LRANSALAIRADAINTLLRDSVHAWMQQWSSLEAAQHLADYFDDQALLLVFGKFNAGKSSFCNFLAERFAAHNRNVQYFHVDAGRVVDTSEPFTEGATETTSRLQGVRLGAKLVLLDTPGLHSVTPQNAALTQRFTDSADGVLWLTSSTSPGQVQELDELAASCTGTSLCCRSSRVATNTRKTKSTANSSNACATRARRGVSCRSTTSRCERKTSSWRWASMRRC
jgi:hypothetical protein